jgi:SAM-dependent methyltransferase
MTEGFYRCLQCKCNISDRDDHDLICEVCDAVYPSVNGVHVFSLDAFELLRAQLTRFTQRRKEVEACRAKLADESVEGDQSEILLANGYDAQLANLRLIEELMKPVSQYLLTQSKRSVFDQLQLSDAGWESYQTLYFVYQDWGRTREREFLKRLFIDAVQQYCADAKDSVAILGCGSCGLVYELAEFFPVVFGLDLSVDILLLGKILLEGAQVDLHFNFPHDQTPLTQSVVSLKGADRKRSGIQLVGADAKRLPFRSASLSCVVTSYLLDVVPSAHSLISEIARVLTPEGIWINFSNLPYRREGVCPKSYDARLSLDLASHLDAAGLTLLEMEKHQFKLGMSDITDWAYVRYENPVFFVARRSPIEQDEQTSHFVEYFSGQGEGVWETVPRIATYVGLMHEKRVNGARVEERKRLALFSPNQSLPVTDEAAFLAGLMLNNIDEKHTTRDIFELLCSTSGQILEPREFLRFFSRLADKGVIKLT